MTPAATGADTRIRRLRLVFAGLVLLLAGSILLSLFVGSVNVPFGDTLDALLGGDGPRAVLVRDFRIPRTVTALTVGAALGLAGMQMQTLFRNPLADPYILGASSGASLGVAIVVLLGGSSAAAGFTRGLTAMGRNGTVIAAAIGAGVVLAIIAVLSRWVRSSVALLLVGVMLASVSTAAVSVMLTMTQPQLAQQFLVWGMGTFRASTDQDLQIMVPLVIAGIVLAALTVRPLNALLLGEGYARSMGIGIGRTRVVIIVSSAILAGVTTAFCGPIGFLGLVIPHLARFTVGSSDHRLVMPATLLIGAALALICGVIAELPGATDKVLPLGAVTALFGAPVVIFVLVRASRGRLSGVGL